MNRSELVAALADRAEVTRKDADAVLAAFAETVGEIVAKGDEKVAGAVAGAVRNAAKAVGASVTGPTSG